MTIIADESAIFPFCPTFGYVAEPNYLVKIVAREGGYERRQRVWATPLTKYTAVPSGDQAQGDIIQAYKFWHAMGGMATAFRFKDWLDFMSCDLDETPAVTDQVLEANHDSPVKYQLVKQYVVGSIVQPRYIQRPVGSTIMIGNTSGAIQPSSSWTLDESTGVVTIGEGFTGTPGCWGGEFYVWVRFDAQFNPSFSNHKVLNVQIQLAELRQPLA